MYDFIRRHESLLWVSNYNLLQPSISEILASIDIFLLCQMSVTHSTHK